MEQHSNCLQTYCGNLYQICGTRHYSLSESRTNGCRCIDVRTGSGLDFTVVPDRAMDISLASYRGINLAFLTACAESHPSYYESFGNEWLRTFTAGLLTTLGPTYLGPPCLDEGEALGLHGRMSTIPAQHVLDLSNPAAGRIELRGTIQDACTFGHKLQIRRTIQAGIERPVLKLEDEISNFGGRPVPLCMLYHINFGFPLLNEHAKLLVPDNHCTPLDEASAACPANCVKAPDGQNAERNYSYTFAPDQDLATVGIWNSTLGNGLGVFILFNPRQLPHMNQWLLENPADYVAALEPATCPCKSRSELRKSGLLPMLAPGETRKLSIQIGVMQDAEERTLLFGR